jgi:hypothetical protein
VQVVHAGAGEALAGLVGADPGLANQDDLAVEPGGPLGGVLTSQAARQAVAAGDVAGLELGGAADVEHGDGVRSVIQSMTVDGSTSVGAETGMGDLLER